MRSFVFSLLWKLALSRTTISHGLSSGQRHSSIQVLNISVLVLHSNLIGASTVSPLTQARRVVLLYLYPYCSELIGFPTGDQPLLFISLWSIPLSSMYMIPPPLVISRIFSRVAIMILKASLCSPFLSRYVTSFFYNCSSCFGAVSILLLRRRENSFQYPWEYHWYVYQHNVWGLHQRIVSSSHSFLAYLLGFIIFSRLHSTLWVYLLKYS